MMSNKGVLLIISTVVLLLLNHLCETSPQQPQQNLTHHHHTHSNYIVQLQHDPEEMMMTEDSTLHFQRCQTLLASVSQSAHIHYAYNVLFYGFSAAMSPEDVETLRQHTAVVRIYPERIYQLHTTRTPTFLGITGRHEHQLPPSVDVSNVIIGVLDTGVWPESESFKDQGLTAVPSRWKGTCVDLEPGSCNRKLIGARDFSKAQNKYSARDDVGHGTHTASTAAGSAVRNANLFGFANGTARGMALTARLATYKVCGPKHCPDVGILAAMEQAVQDGVDIISLSLGSPNDPYDHDVVAIGALEATKRGIFVSCSAGNDGPSPFSVENTAPWITTVGAGTLDRDFPTTITLGNGEKISGVSFYNGSPITEPLPLVYAGNVSNNNNRNGSLCIANSLNPKQVQGKIVVCDRGRNARVEKSFVVKSAGGRGMILANSITEGDELTADAHILPSAAVTYLKGEQIKSYIFQHYSNANAMIGLARTSLDVQPSPVVAAFSSRGPNPITQYILKPDIIAPGVNILAAWGGAQSPTEFPNDTRRVSFNIMSGTSMSCPHVSGLAALIKAARPRWSPAAVRSALMTTAYVANQITGKPILDEATENSATAFDYGAGHVDLVKALHPGLIYDITYDDYINFICALKYTSFPIPGKKFTCKGREKYKVENLNYPSFAVPFQSNSSRSAITYTRTVTNVGGVATTYNVRVNSPAGVNVDVQPRSMKFRKAYEQKNYSVTFKACNSKPIGSMEFGSLEWKDATHSVKSKIAITWT